MPFPVRLAVVVAVALMFAPRVATGAQRSKWTLERLGVSFELTASDLRAWTGDPAGGPPVFSMASLLDAKKKDFDARAAELARDLAHPDAPEYPSTTMTEAVMLEVLSVVGPLVSYRESGGGDIPGAAHSSGYEVLRVRDVRRPDAKVSLLDFFPEAQVVSALKADPWVRKFANPAKGFARAASLKDLVASLDAEWAQDNADYADRDCTVDVSFDAEMVEQFFFHHVAKDGVAVRIAVGAGSEWCNRAEGAHQIGLLLPVPASLKDDLAKARRGEAGFVASTRKAAGSPTYSETWEVDLRTLVPPPSPQP